MSLIACCLCGQQITPNAAAMCIDCLKIEVDLSTQISKNVDLIQCGKCGRWCLRNNQWMHHELESGPLLAMCLKKIPGLDRSDITIRDASWIWTEPHSKRLKVAVDIESGVLDEKVRVAQKLIVDFKISNKQCIECIRENTDHTWGACVQLRQRVGHKMSFFHLETSLIKARLHNSMLDVKVTKEGIDMFFKNKTQAQRVVSFVNTLFPTTTKTSKKLIGMDRKSNVHRNEFVVSMEVVPLCRYDLVVTPREPGRAPELMLVAQLSTNVHLINPQTLAKAEWNAPKFFAKPVKPLLSARHLIKFIVLNITPLVDSGAAGVFALGDSEASVKVRGGVLAEAEIARESDFGFNDTIFVTVTHLGHLLKPGDTVLGYDLSNVVMDIASESRFNDLSHEPLEIVLVKKFFEKTGAKKKKARRQRRPQRRRGGEDTEGDGAELVGELPDLEELVDRSARTPAVAEEEQPSEDQGHPSWRMISDSIMYGGDGEEAALQMEMMEEIDDDDDDLMVFAEGAVLEEAGENNEELEEESA